MLDNFFGSRPRLDSEHVAAIKRWTMDLFHLPEDTSVLVTELRCTEPGCPPLETVIAILDTPGHPRQHKIHKGHREVTRDDVERLSSGSSSCPTDH